MNGGSYEPIKIRNANILQLATRKKKEDQAMKKNYKIEVDCANCALKMEETAKKVEGVQDATVSFMTQKMKVEFAEGADEKSVMEAVRKACKKVESDCEIYLD